MRDPKKTLTKVSGTAIRFGGGCVFSPMDRYCGSRWNNRRRSCHAAEMFKDLVRRGSFISVFVPASLDQFPCASTKANFRRFFWFVWPFALHYAQYDFLVSAFLHSEGDAPSKDFVDNHSEGIYVCLLGNPACAEAKFLGVKQFWGHVSPCTLGFISTRRHDEGHGGCEGRKTEIGDTRLRCCSVLDQDVSLGQGDIGSTKLDISPTGGALDTDNVTHPFQVPMDNSAFVKVL